MACPRDRDIEYFFTWTLVGLNDTIIHFIKPDPRDIYDKDFIFKVK